MLELLGVDLDLTMPGVELRDLDLRGVVVLGQEPEGVRSNPQVRVLGDQDDRPLARLRLLLFQLQRAGKNVIVVLMS